MRRPSPNAGRANPAPSPRMRRTTEANASAATLKLMKPGPAIATEAIEGDSGSRATMRSAISRGLARAARAKARATGLAKSPWPSPRLRSTGISGGGSRAGSPSSRSAASACARSDRMWSFTGRTLRGSPGRGPHASADPGTPARRSEDRNPDAPPVRREDAHSNPPCPPILEADRSCDVVWDAATGYGSAQSGRLRKEDGAWRRFDPRAGCRRDRRGRRAPPLRNVAHDRPEV